MIIARLMLSGNSKFRLRWDLFVMILAVYNCFEIPFSVAFDPDVTLISMIWERIVDILFVADVIFNFRSTYTD